MVDALESNEKKLKKAKEELSAAKDPVELEQVLTKIDNLLDIRLSLTKMREVAANGN